MPSNTLEKLNTEFGYLFEEKLIQEIDKVATFYSGKANDTFLEIGDKIPGMPLLLAGSMKIFREDDQGNELLLYYLESGDTCAMTLTCCMGNAVSNVRVILEEDSELVLVPVEKMEQWIVEFRSWRSFVLGSYNNRLNELLNAIDSLAFKKLDERLWNYLVDKVKITGSMELQITHHEIAEELNSSRVVISRLLKQLENNRKLNLHRNTIEMLEF